MHASINPFIPCQTQTIHPNQTPLSVRPSVSQMKKFSDREIWKFWFHFLDYLFAGKRKVSSEGMRVRGWGEGCVWGGKEGGFL